MSLLVESGCKAGECVSEQVVRLSGAGEKRPLYY
jgi:hypothetical protein